jgi:ribonuclease VapC
LIVLDTSALMALLLGEAEAELIGAILASDEEFVIAAGTLAEALIVAGRRGLQAEMSELLDGLGVVVDTLSAAEAYAVAEAYACWGKGLHPAGLNFGDCFAYVTAKVHGAPLMFVGEDFAKTDVVSALPAKL